MTQEEKLLIRDICAQLPYGVYVKFKQYNEPLCLSVKDAFAINNGGEIISDLQYLYLRPMSSMTDGEINEFILILDTVLWLGNKRSTCILSLEQTDWLNAHHFDYRGLIEKGLALEAPEGMYKI